jgi:AcrR family transcriptional regulator
MTPKQSPPARRADAERNRAKILTAARAAFADPNTDAEVSMAEIARRARVGMATLYRNFPGRRELLEALYNDEIDAGCQAAETLAGASPAEALMAWLRQFLAFVPSKRLIVSELLADTDHNSTIVSTGRERVIAAGRPLLAAAQQAHEIRDDLTLEQILDMLRAVATINNDPDYVQPILQAALDGLRPAANAEAK